MEKTRLMVVKVGGNIIDDEKKLSSFLQDFAAIDSNKILVHGGGKMATRVAEALGIEQKMVEGRRITDSESLKVVTMVYAGFINKNIVAALQAFNCQAMGLCGADGSAVLAHKRREGSSAGKAGVDYGFAGDVDKVNIDLLSQLLLNNYALVLAPITHDGKGQLLNTNADTMASEVAVSLSNQFHVRLIYCFEKKGILENIQDDESVVAALDKESYRKLKDGDKLFEGIIPKIDNAFSAIEAGVQEVLIGHADDLLQNTTQNTRGTLIR
jgi:acetylglutamate kinase